VPQCPIAVDANGLVTTQTPKIPYVRDRSLGSLRAHEALVERLDEVVVLDAAARALGQPTAVAEVGRRVGRAARAASGEDDRGTTAAAAGAPGGTARRAGEHVVRVHRAEHEAPPGRPAAAAEPARDRVSTRAAVDGRTSSAVRQRAEAGEADGVQVQHPAVVDDRNGHVRLMTADHVHTGRPRVRSGCFVPVSWSLSGGTARSTCHTRWHSPVNFYPTIPLVSNSGVPTGGSKFTLH